MWRRMWEYMGAGCYRSVTERAVYPKSGGQSGIDISHKQDFLHFEETVS